MEFIWSVIDTYLAEKVKYIIKFIRIVCEILYKTKLALRTTGWEPLR